MESNDLPVPAFGQSTTWYCGFAAMQMVLAYHGTYHTQDWLAKQFPDKKVLSVHDFLEQKSRHKRARQKLEGQNGIFSPDMTRFLRSFGYSARERYHLTIADLCDSIDDKIPIIARTKMYRSPHDNNTGHFIVVHGYTPSSILINDPYNLEHRNISRKKFALLWNFGKKDNYGIFVKKR